MPCPSCPHVTDCDVTVAIENARKHCLAVVDKMRAADNARLEQHFGKARMPDYFTPQSIAFMLLATYFAIRIFCL